MIYLDFITMSNGDGLRNRLSKGVKLPCGGSVAIAAPRLVYFTQSEIPLVYSLTKLLCAKSFLGWCPYLPF